MADKKIRDYVPGENDFLHFAEIMNRNAAIDFKNAKAQSGGVAGATRANVGDAPPPVVNNTGDESLSGPARYSKIYGDFKNALKLSSKGIGINGGKKI